MLLMVRSITYRGLLTSIYFNVKREFRSLSAKGRGRHMVSYVVSRVQINHVEAQASDRFLLHAAREPNRRSRPSMRPSLLRSTFHLTVIFKSHQHFATRPYKNQRRTRPITSPIAVVENPGEIPELGQRQE